MQFSERVGLVRRLIQKDSIDEALKNALWNSAYGRYWGHYSQNAVQSVANVREGRLLSALWTEHFGQRVDEFQPYFPLALQAIKRLFVASDWASVYDFIEFIATCEVVDTGPFIADCNRALKKHVSAYRFVGNKLVPITSDETALKRLADRANPDYRNSIKESISAVEAACQIITKKPSISLGQALKALNVHPALEKGFSAIYGYTSDAQGIRHALSEEPHIGADDAKLFLVSCSAFVNYPIAKSAATCRGPESPNAG